MPTPRKLLRIIEAPTTQDLLDSLIPDALAALENVLRDPEAPAGARVSAAREVLNRTAGVPGLAPEPETKARDMDMSTARASSEYARLRMTYSHLPDDELPAHIQKALAGLDKIIRGETR
ncbi:hypothetical protein [Acidithiobacillus thiooxidans]|uniref:hypothetical protein n=1 Tax=Acidithiobacillus thiooxidans TaxID=930 RepID=UPI0004E1086A|nr:hypothetical protein [Acidithiobacillus thiooxidans]